MSFRDPRGAVTSRRKGSWSFSWGLDGRAIPDVVEYARPDVPGGVRRIGSTRRSYDAKLDHRLVTWGGATSRAAIHLEDGRVGDRLVLEGPDADGSRLRRTFNDIAGDTFHGIGCSSRDGGQTRRIEPAMSARRRWPAAAARALWTRTDAVAHEMRACRAAAAVDRKATPLGRLVRRSLPRLRRGNIRDREAPNDPPVMKLKNFAATLSFSAALLGAVARADSAVASGDPLAFDESRYTERTVTIAGQAVGYRAYEGIVDVAKPVDAAYQQLNFYVPDGYYRGETIGGYTAATAPIFFPNTVGGYMPGRPGQPAVRDGRANAIALALAKGYVVAVPGARGRTLKDAAGNFTGKAPACIVDLKAAVCYLRHNDARMPGDAEKIISNGTSAGGALSALLGATGNAPGYAPYLAEIGAAEARDDIFATSAYCPITDLDHADAAYEWLFGGVNTFVGRGPSGALTAQQIEVSAQLKAMFPAYVNGLALTGPDGAALRLDANGEGSFREFVKSLVLASAQTALDRGENLTGLSWLAIEGGRATAMDFGKFAAYATRMKTPPAFDALDLRAPENNLFGTATVDSQHFTAFAQEHGSGRARADEAVVALMNPMNAIGGAGVATAKFWRIRQGVIDRDTSLAIPVLLATALRNHGCDVDLALPWARGHGGDYDLEELFAWMARVGAR